MVSGVALLWQSLGAAPGADLLWTQQAVTASMAGQEKAKRSASAQLSAAGKIVKKHKSSGGLPAMFKQGATEGPTGNVLLSIDASSNVSLVSASSGSSVLVVPPDSGTNGTEPENSVNQSTKSGEDDGEFSEGSRTNPNDPSHPDFYEFWCNKQEISNERTVEEINLIQESILPLFPEVEGDCMLCLSSKVVLKQMPCLEAHAYCAECILKSWSSAGPIRCMECRQEVQSLLCRPSPADANAVCPPFPPEGSQADSNFVCSPLSPGGSAIDAAALDLGESTKGGGGSEAVATTPSGARKQVAATHSSVSEAVITKRTASQYRREIRDKFRWRFNGADGTKTKVPLDDEQIAERRKKLECYEAVRPYRLARAKKRLQTHAAEMQIHAESGEQAVQRARKHAKTVINAVMRLLKSVDEADTHFDTAQVTSRAAIEEALEHLSSEDDDALGDNGPLEDKSENEEHLDCGQQVE